MVELASIEDVPHAVHQFLEQVQHGLWAGCFFYLNGPHVVQAGPALAEDDDADAEEGEDTRISSKPFQELGLDYLAFPDYSDNFPPEVTNVVENPTCPDMDDIMCAIVSIEV